MSGIPTDRGDRLQQKWGIPAKQTRYHRQGTFYMPLTDFPGALADRKGHVVFPTKADLDNCPGVEYRGQGTPNLRLGVPRGIRKLPGYVRMLK